MGRLQNAASPNVSVENYGTSSYSPALYLLQWRTWIRDRGSDARVPDVVRKRHSKR